MSNNINNNNILMSARGPTAGEMINNYNAPNTMLNKLKGVSASV